MGPEPRLTAIKDEINATSTELPSAAVSRVSPSTSAYQRKDGPLKGGTGNCPS